MSAYTEEALIDKLNKLNNTQPSIETLSHWVMFHRKRYVQSIQVWDREIYKAQKERKLVYLYLANEIMQTSRKKGGEFIKEFSKVLPGAILHTHRECGVEKKKALFRLLTIWEERRVYPTDYVEGIRRSLRELPASGGVHHEVAIQSSNQQLLGSSLSSKAQTEPVSTLIRELEDHEVNTTLIAKKLPSPSLLSGELLKNCSNQAQVSELAIELEDAIDILDRYHNSLENDLKMRNKLVVALRDYVNVQEAQIRATQTKLQECDRQLSVIGPLKGEVQGLYAKFRDEKGGNQTTPKGFQRTSDAEYVQPYSPSSSSPLNNNYLNDKDMMQQKDEQWHQ